MKVLEDLRIQLTKDYPGDSPAFPKLVKDPEEVKFFFEKLVIPAFEKIKKEFEPFHFEVTIRRHLFITRLEVKDGCTQFSLSIKVSRKFACVILTAGYRDDSICVYEFKEPVLLEERFDLSRISQDLPEELIITIFSDTFINRRTYLKRITDTAKNIELEKAELLREERRTKLLFLKTQNKKFDPRDLFRKYLDSPDLECFLSWLDVVLNESDG